MVDLYLLQLAKMDGEDVRARLDVYIFIGSTIGTNWLIRFDADVHLNHDIHALLVLHCIYSFNILK